VHLLLTQSAWWDRLTAEDHELLHALPAPHGELIAWLERDIVEHGPRPWAAVRTALMAHEGMAAELAALRLDDSEDYDAGPADLRLLLDGRLLGALEARQRELVALAADNAQARAEYQASLARAHQLRVRIQAARQEASPT
jgi:DNA primase